MKKAENFLNNIRGRTLSSEERSELAIKLAKILYEESIRERRPKEAKQEKLLARIMADPKGRTFMTLFTDLSCRARSDERTVDQLLHLIKKMGIPSFFNRTEQLKLFLFRSLGPLFPSYFVKKIKQQLRNEMAGVLVPDDPKEFAQYNKECRKQNIELNINHLGEAILGEDEAKRRLDRYLQDFDDPSITYISVKISTLYSQINEVAWENSLAILEERLAKLYRKAVNRFVNLDMEEYKDLDLTVELFKRILSREEFKSYYGGIVLQAYLPDAFEKQIELTEWAEKRGHPIKIRLVKGANLAMEQIESSRRNWSLATLDTKIESDANFKRMLNYAMEHTAAVHIGIGSHNLFDIAYALILRAETGNEERVNFEMLSGMATSTQRVITKLTGKLILYAPEAKSENFDHAVAYLIRRLDENGGADNFLRHYFHLDQEAIWKRQAENFRNSCTMHLRTTSKRLEAPTLKSRFNNEPDLDFSLKANRQLVQKVLSRRSYPRIPLVIGGQEREGEWASGTDPSNPDSPIYEYALASEADVKEAIAAAEPPPQNLLPKVAELMRKRKADLLHAMTADVGKSILEGNGEISEAIDFLEYYSQTTFPKNYEWKSRGTIVVASPWNFPISIPTGGIAAALAAGNPVIFKPAPEAVLAGWTLVQMFWEAGISKESLQFINCIDDPVGSSLIKDPRIKGVILTGATSTAKKFLEMRPDLYLMAETGGKNAIIATALCDRDLAIKDIIQSAFGYSGQKCSACSLLILEKELYHDDHFLQQLKDAAQSLNVGSAWNPASTITPLIRPPGEDLKRALTTLEEGEEWLLEPRPDPDNPHLWSPGIKMHVKPGSYTHKTEFFGPLLAILSAEHLEEAIEIANGTPYGLTSGLHSLDEREQKVWLSKITAGNLYINRNITGAIVERQPFGGCKASSFGPGAKAGGPHYVWQLAIPIEKELTPLGVCELPQALIPIIAGLHKTLNDEERALFLKSVKSYAYWAKKYKTPVDPSQILGQKNLFYLVPRDKMVICIKSGDRPCDYLRAIAACHICNVPFEVVEDEAAHEGRKRSFDTPVYASGELELLHYLREVSLSHDTHRYGYLCDDSL